MPELTDKESLKQRIVEESKVYLSDYQDPDEFTINDFMEANNIGRDSATRVLNEMVNDGKLEKRGGGQRGKKTFYKFKEEENGITKTTDRK